MAEFFKDFDDAFFYWIAVICAALAFTDWAIGPTARAAMRERIAEWWIRLDDSSFSGLVARDAVRVRAILLKYTGKSWYSVRRIWRSVLLSTLALFLVALLFMELNLIDSFNAEYAGYFILMIPPNAVFDWIMLNLTIVLLGYVASSTSILRLSIIAFVGGVSIVLKAIVVLILFLLLGLMLSHFIEFLEPADALLGRIFGPAPELGPPPCIECVFEGVFDTLIVVVFAAVTACIWSMFSVISAFTFASSKIFSPAIKPVLLWLLYRFQESDKGVLTVASAGLGGIAKLVQQAVKLTL
ncbi:hypothetical protein GGQ64_004599 [Rhizobium azooxidifex]|uniref:Uncharacterized protein n=1 Tax=Mycoplana azooxidifex TaxID=1636188 RepID=A0A7W6DB83_9HYPH|nr:hypothetical protein [Mycoplana azooxidifex]MBB3979359.1 hypothetical protein [Mycoplana azooxidifex]